MAIRFPCRACKQLLGIASRKVGTEIECPKCGQSQVVPTKEQAAALTSQADREEDLPQENGRIVVYDEEPIPPPETPEAGAVSGEQPSLVDEAAAALPVETLRPLPPGMILYTRGTLYWQAVLIAVVGAAGFASGYFVGRGDAVYEERTAAAEAAKVPVIVEGKLLYRPDELSIAGDEDAVVIALPAGREPDRTFTSIGIRPRDPAPRESERTLRAIAELGGAYARADEAGDFWLQVPDQGEYYFLLVSRHADRPKDAPLEELDADEMRAYFTSPADLVGRSKYRWTLESAAPGMARIEWDFGRDGVAGGAPVSGA